MKLEALQEAKVLGGGKGSLEWFLNTFCTLKYEATEDSPTNEYHVKSGFHIYDRSGRRVFGAETWKDPSGGEDWSLTVGRKEGGGIMGGAYDPIEQLTIYKAEKIWGPE